MDGNRQDNVLPINSVLAPSSSTIRADEKEEEFVVLDGLSEAQTQQVVSTLVLFKFLRCSANIVFLVASSDWRNY